MLPGSAFHSDHLKADLHFLHFLFLLFPNNVRCSSNVFTSIQCRSLEGECAIAMLK